MDCDLCERDTETTGGGLVAGDEVHCFICVVHGRSERYEPGAVPSHKDLRP